MAAPFGGLLKYFTGRAPPKSNLSVQEFKFAWWEADVSQVLAPGNSDVLTWCHWTSVQLQFFKNFIYLFVLQVKTECLHQLYLYTAAENNIPSVDHTAEWQMKKALCPYLHVNELNTQKSTFFFACMCACKKSCSKALGYNSIQPAEISPIQQKYAVRFEGEECTFNLENSCEGEIIWHMCFQQLDLLFLFVRFRSRKRQLLDCHLCLYMSLWVKCL